MMRGQSALEYLIMIIAVLAVVAIVVLFVSGALGTQKQAASFEECRTAAAECAKERLLNPKTPCTMCDGPCSDKYAVYLELCKKGLVDEIFEPECGDGKQGAYEQCDGTDFNDNTCATVLGSTYSGTLACTSQCTLDTNSCYPCGDGTVNGLEQCDGADLDGKTCQSFGFEKGGLACYSVCLFNKSDCHNCADIYKCTHGDECCTAGCNANNDNDCPPVCGNTIIEPGEDCDGFNLGVDNCVSLGYDGGVLSCNACDFNEASCYMCPLVTSCISGDGCCPGACNALPTDVNYDTDCPVVCGNNVVEPGEVCDNTNLAGQSCATQGFTSGMITCAVDCNTFNTAACEKWYLSDLGAIMSSEMSANLALDPSTGYPRTAYYQGSLYYSAWNGTSWQNVVVSAGEGQYPSLALTSAGKPRITYRKLGGAKLWLASCNAADCATNAASWTTVEIISQQTDGSAIKISSAGNLRALDYRISGEEMYLASNDSGSWQSIMVSSGMNLDYISGNSMALNSTGDGARIIAYNTNKNNATYVSCNKTVSSWTCGTASILTGATGPSIALYGNQPRVAYCDQISGGLKYAYCDTANCNLPASWTIVNIPTPPSCTINSETSIVLDASGNPRISYQSAAPNLRYAYCDSACSNAANWVTQLVDTANSGSSSSLALYNGKPRVIYETFSTTLKYAEFRH